MNSDALMQLACQVDANSLHLATFRPTAECPTNL